MVAKTFFLEYQEFIKNLSDETILQKYDKISLCVFADKRECSQKAIRRYKSFDLIRSTAFCND